jgi:hypothetical protein
MMMGEVMSAYALVVGSTLILTVDGSSNNSLSEAVVIFIKILI